MNYKNIEILYEDNHLLVVVKPQGVPSQADKSGDEDMLGMLKAYLKEKYDKPGNVYLGLVHRLDRPTGGVMVFAKTSKSASRLTEQIKDGTLSKRYLAVLTARPAEKRGRLTHYLVKDEASNMVRVAPMTTEGAKRPCWTTTSWKTTTRKVCTSRTSSCTPAAVIRYACRWRR